MDMLDMSVTLIVKAPNQQIEDQTIKCEPSWTIKKLKGHLSEVYPSKPRTEDQKLIYSGKLLSDSEFLKDILRWYEGQQTHTVHLVCSPPRDCAKRSSGRPQPRMNEKRSTTSVPGAGESTGNANLTSPDSTDGIRQRLASSEIPPNTTSGQFAAANPGAVWAAAMSQPYAAGYDPNNMVQQLALMQQAYAHYMAQYMQLMASGAGAQNIHPQVPHSQVTVPPQTIPEQPVPPADQQEEVAEPVNDNANLIEGEEEGRGNRDWLDWFYFMSRLMVLFSIVYFYSSPTRFIIVSALGIMMYLYQVGFFRIQQQQLQVARVAPENNNIAMDAVDARAVDNNNVEQNEAEVQGPQIEAQSAGSEAEVPGPEPDRPSLLAITWTFFTSFFASLIPEQPGAL